MLIELIDFLETNIKRFYSNDTYKKPIECFDMYLDVNVGSLISYEFAYRVDDAYIFKIS